MSPIESLKISKPVSTMECNRISQQKDIIHSLNNVAREILAKDAKNYNFNSDEANASNTLNSQDLMIKNCIAHPAIISRAHKFGHNLVKASLQDSDDPASYTASSISCLLRVRVVCPAVVISSSVKDQTPADDVVLAVQLDLVVGEVDMGGLRGVKLDVAEVSDVTVLVLGMAMVFLEK